MKYAVLLYDDPAAWKHMGGVIEVRPIVER